MQKTPQMANAAAPFMRMANLLDYDDRSLRGNGGVIFLACY